MPRIRAILTATFLCSLGCTALQAATLGEARVLSQQGQRLKVAVPVKAAAGERLPLMRISVASATLANGSQLSADNFTVSAADRGNVVYLQSREVIKTSNVKLVVDIANEPGARGQYDLTVPSATYARPGDAPQAAGFGRGEQMNPATGAKKAKSPRKSARASAPKAAADWAPKKAKCSC